MEFAFVDYLIFFGYCGFIIFLGLYVSREKKGHQKDSKDYFLASKSLPWWAVGASLIASNISAEQVIGMSGSGFALGLGIATYEWMAAATLLVVGKFFIPIFLKKGIYTMPQFLEQRYDGRVRSVLAVFWLVVFVFVNLTTVMYLGALALEGIMGVPMMWGIISLAAFSALYSIYGGLKAVAFTDAFQVVFLVLGGLVTTWLALEAVSLKYSGVENPFTGFADLIRNAPEKFQMIFSKGDTYTEMENGERVTKSAYQLLPGIAVLVGGMWITNLYYWGFNQYITQRALAAKSLDEAQRGIMFAGYLKLFMPLIVVIPGIAAFLITQGDPVVSIDKSDEAYPFLLNQFVPTGLKGLAFAALIAAIVSSLSSMINSISTIFSMDIYKIAVEKTGKVVSESNLVLVGRIVAAVSLIIAVVVAPALSSLGQVFQYIQEFTGFFSPGILAIFLFGFFWKKTTANAAFTAAIVSLPLSILFKVLGEEFLGVGPVLDAPIPFLVRMGWVFLLVSATLIGVTLMERKGEHPKAIDLSPGLFKTSKVFTWGGIGILIILAILYTLFWNVETVNFFFLD